MNRALIVKIIALTVWGLLLFAPFLFQDVRQIEVAARICVFIVLVASYDLLIGYTGIVSFAHVMFFGFGAYGVAISMKHLGAGWGPWFLGLGAGVVVAAVMAVLIGLLSLRVKAIFFAMITLAAASVALVLASQLSSFTGGEDGMTYSVQSVFKPATKILTDAEGKVLQVAGVRMNGKVLLYYFVFAISAGLFWTMLRIVGSPLGTVLKAIRENEARAEGIGYRVVAYRTSVFLIAAVTAALAGGVYATWLKYTGPETTLSFAIMIDILLMVVIGGMGTMWGAVIGATLMVLAQYYLRDLMEVAAGATANIPLLPDLLSPDRWLLWLGLAFILLVYFFPAGIAGTIMEGRRK
ncbi:branched-chain amino acid ABC transporter permease [uncultured Maritimibacter sp.]|jgi:branched-chain amino acid transport system permease protein|uniref:branched-chain amino acid ABC transporter permease n=1 Tax=uncultured Maritimibacter sp. TaxID=991866 RepID=UPI000B2E6EFC|nr:branched-chain amino acid ABC transporter permease [uncultured Maritimibacter sp.]